MSDEQVTSPAGEVTETTAVAEAPRGEPRDDNAPEGAAQVETEENAEGEEVTVEELELDIGGSKHKFKKGTPIEEVLEPVQKYQKGLESKLQRESQAIATERKSIEEASKLTQRLHSLGMDQARDMARGQELAKTIDYYERPEIRQALSELWRSNPDQARQSSDALAAARSEFREIESRLAQYGQHLNETERQHVEVRSREGEAIVAKAIKGFSPQVESEMVAYAVQNGVSEQDAKQWRLHPFAATMTIKAMKYDRLMAQGAAATKPSAAPAPDKPVTAIKGGRGANATSSRDLDSMPMDEYAAYRRKQNSRSR